MRNGENTDALYRRHAFKCGMPDRAFAFLMELTPAVTWDTIKRTRVLDDEGLETLGLY